MKMTCMTTLISSLAMLLLAVPALAGPIDLRVAAGNSNDAGTPGVSTVWASSHRPIEGRAPSGVSNGNGMTWTDPAWTGGDASGVHGIEVDPNNMWSTSADQAPQSNQSLTTQFIGWNLGAVYTLDKVHVWNYNEVCCGGTFDLTNRGISGLDIQTSVDGSTWVTVQAGVDWSANQAPGTTTYTGFDHSLTGITTQYIRFANLTNFSGGGSFGGLSEVVFYDTSAVPEPSTFALAALGLVGLGWFGIRRRKG